MITIFQHGKDESAGEIECYLGESVISYTIVRLYETNEIPAKIPANLIVLGGQMSVNDIKEYPYFTLEKEIIRKMVAGQRPVFGICLGAQMIASAFGERVFPSTSERGWRRVWGNPPGNISLFRNPCNVFHWHNETFNLPKQAILLLRVELVHNQAFRLGSAVGVQFHPEVTMQIISRWSAELGLGERRQLLKDSEHEIVGNKERCRILTEKFLHRWGS